MRVLHVLAERGYSGGEIQLEHVVRHLHSQGHDNALVLAPDAEFARIGTELGLPVERVDMRRPWWPGERSRLRRAIRAFAPDVLHFGCGRSLLWGGLWSRGIDVPLRITSRRIDYPIGRSWFRGGRYRQLVDHTVANCESVRRRVLDAGVPEDRVTLVHEGIDVEPWAEALAARKAARERLGIAGDAVVISQAATLRPRKGQRELIDAFARIAGEHDRAILVLAGGGPDKDELVRRAERAGLAERILVPGPIKPVSDLYAATDLSVMPSFHEGLSNACLEASAAGLPLVVSTAGGLPEIVEDGVTGAVVPPGDVEALASALARYVADPDLRRRAGAAGRERTRANFTAERMARGIEELFRRLLDVRLPRSQA